MQHADPMIAGVLLEPYVRSANEPCLEGCQRVDESHFVSICADRSDVLGPQHDFTLHRIITQHKHPAGR